MQTLLRSRLPLMLAAGIVLCSLSLSGQPMSAISPEKAGMDAKRLQRIDGVIQSYIDQNRVPGAVALVIRDGQVVYHKAFGIDRPRERMRTDAIFRIASQSKAITSVALMLLYEEGLFQLDDPISAYVPAFGNAQVLDKFNPADSSYTTIPAKRPPTIRQLLTHTSGIGYPVIGSPEARAIYANAGIPSGIGTVNERLDSVVHRLARLPLLHQPGEKFTYGLNLEVAGYLVEILSGKSLDEFMRERLFEPLGMRDTYFYLPTSRHRRLAQLYTEDAKGQTIPMGEQSGINPDYPNESGRFYAGGAGLNATAMDYAIFLQMLLNGGTYNGKRILSPATVRMITSNQIAALRIGEFYDFGLGFKLTTAAAAGRAPLSEGSFEWSGIFGTAYWADPREKLVGLIMTQKYPNSWSDLDDKFKVLVYQAIELSYSAGR